MTHPLQGFGFKFRNFKSFAEDPGDWINFSPITVAVGRNNSGKSALIDALSVVLSAGKSSLNEYHRAGQQYAIEVASVLGERDLRQVFREHTAQGGVPGHSHWAYGQHFVGQPISRSYGADWSPQWTSPPDFSAINEGTRPTYLSLHTPLLR